MNSKKTFLHKRGVLRVYSKKTFLYKRASLLTTILSLSLIFGFTHQSLADTHYAWWDSPGPASPYTTWNTASHTIGPAVGAATSGDTVEVRAGTYSEKVCMKDGVDLAAEAGTKPLITCSPGIFNGVVEFTGPMTCNLTGFDLRYTGMGSGVFVDGSIGQVNGTIDNCTARDGENFGAGISLKGAVSVTITGCDIYRSAGLMRLGIGTTGFGTTSRIASGSSIIIKDTTIGGSGQGLTHAGIRLRGEVGADIQVTIGGSGVGDGNIISDNGVAGILLADINQVSIKNNTISNNGKAGILLVDASTVSPHIGNNTIENHSSAAGINIGGASNVTIWDNNQIYSNKTGITFYVANNPDTFSFQDPITKTASSGLVTIMENDIFLNSNAGIAVKDTITGTVTITQNDIHDNTTAGIGIQNSCTLEITKNEIYDNMRAGIHTGTDSADPGGFSGAAGSAVLTIKQNKVYGNGQTGYGSGIDVRHADGTIYNNLVYENMRAGIRFGDWIDEIINNTVADNGDAAVDRGGGIIYDDINAGDAVNATPAGIPPAALLIRNNISAYNQKAGIRACFDMTENSEERDYNLVYANNGWDSNSDCGWSSDPVGDLNNRGCANQQYGVCGSDLVNYPNLICPNDKMADPEFEDRVAKDYRLKSISPAVDAGDPAVGYNDIEDPVNPGYALFPSQGTVRNDMGAYGGPNPLPYP